MTDNLNQPKKDDAVLGNTNPSLFYGAVLGGVEGIKQRLASSVVEVRTATLPDALKYGEIGLELVLQALQDESIQVRSAAYALLKDRQEPQVKQQLENFDELASNFGVDYRQLRNFLVAGEWNKADEETKVVMLKAARIKEDYLDSYDITCIHCTDLHTIDQLWIKYSKGLFGFSVQRRIWQELGAKVNYETNCRLGHRLGWRMNSAPGDYKFTDSQGNWPINSTKGDWRMNSTGGDYQHTEGHFPSLGLLCQISPYWAADYSSGDIVEGWGAWRVAGWSAENGFCEDGCGAVRFICEISSRLASCGC